MAPTPQTQRYLLLDGRQRNGGIDGWFSRPALVKNVVATAGGLTLSPLPAVAVAPAAGGLPDARAVTACDGARWEIEGDRLLVTPPPAAGALRAVAWKVVGGACKGDRLVYVPVASRIERWPARLGSQPRSADQVEPIRQRVRDERAAHRVAAERAGGACFLGPPDEIEYPGDWLAIPACRPQRRRLKGFGGTGAAPRRLKSPAALALCDSRLFVADTGNHRVQVLDLRGLILRGVWGGPVPGTALGQFDAPASVAVTPGGDVFVADTGNHRVQRRCCRTGAFLAFDGTTLAARVYLVAYGPRRGDRFVYVPALGRLECWPLSPGPAVPEPGSYPTAEAARARVLDVLDGVGASDPLTEWDDRYPAALLTGADVPQALQSPTRVAVCHPNLYVYDAASDDVWVFDLAGRLRGRTKQVAELFPPGAPATKATGALHKAGSLMTDRLDSRTDGCTWHKIALDLVRPAPAGGGVTVWTYSTNDPSVTTGDVTLLGDDAWRTGQSDADDFLVRSAPGRFLWVRIRIAGGGQDSPVVRKLKVYFPRDGYLQYLPAVYQADPTSRDFLDRFLALFQTGFDRFEDEAAHVWRLFNARGTPEPFLGWLAGWVGMTFQPNWPVPDRRELLRQSPELYRRRGTRGGLALFVKLALGLNVRIVEDWRARRWLLLGGRNRLGPGTFLFGDCVGGRLRLDVNSRVGGFRLDDVGQPCHDPFAADAHGFTVYVDGPLSEGALRGLRQLIDQEKPAHTRYSVRTVGGRFRVGVESSVGLDTGIGPTPRADLGRASTLGYDAVLARDPAAPGSVTTLVGSMRVG